MKNQKAGDKNNWKSDWIKEGRYELVENLAKLFNRIEEEKRIPKQLRETKVKSLYKR